MRRLELAVLGVPVPRAMGLGEVEWNKGELPVQYGQLTSHNTRTRKIAGRALAEMTMQHQIYTTLQYLTNEIDTFR
jgi:hypothetical protein